MLEAEDGQTEVGEDARLGDEGQRAEYLLDGDASHRREIQVRVVRHDEAGEEDGHDARELDGLGEHVRRVHEDEHERGLERGRLSQVDILEQLKERRRGKLGK